MIRLTVEEIRRIWNGEAAIPKGARVIVPTWNLERIYPDQQFELGEYATVLSEPELPVPIQIEVLVDGKTEPVKVFVHGLLL